MEKNRQSTINNKKQSMKFNLTKPHHLLATGFGAGLLKPAPGTWGTLAAIPFIYCMHQFNDIIYWFITVVAGVLGVWICGQCAKDIGEHDHESIVWDEFVGLFITLSCVDVTLLNVFLGFILFRFFDIVKPWPIVWLDEHVDGGLGIMMDDIIAGLMALLVLQVLVNYLLI